jgi:hypothetical protein
MAASIRIVTKRKTALSNRVTALAKTCLISTVCFLVSTASGCGLMGNFMYIVKGIDLPAEFDELKDKRVAVVVSTNAGLNSDASGILMSRHINELFARNIKKVDMVNPEEVDRIINDQAANERSMSAIGGQLKADYVVLVELSNLKLRDGQTLFKGRCNSSVSAYKVVEGIALSLRNRFPNLSTHSMVRL